jgi:hypothetical protein
MDDTPQQENPPPEASSQKVNIQLAKSDDASTHFINDVLFQGTTDELAAYFLISGMGHSKPTIQTTLHMSYGAAQRIYNKLGEVLEAHKHRTLQVPSELVDKVFANNTQSTSEDSTNEENSDNGR